MQYRRLGGSDLTVSAYCLGTYMFGSAGNSDVGACIRMIHTAMDAGINFFDTADGYSEGQAQSILSGALKGGRRQSAVIASKVGYRHASDPTRGGLSAAWIREAVAASLRRLGTDYIDVLILHRPDPTVPVDETLEAVASLVQSGAIRSYGCSTFPAWMIADLQCASDRANAPRAACEQPPYSILARGIELDVLPVAARFGMGVMVWSPLAGGWLTGKYRRDQPPPAGSRAERAAEFGAENPRIGARYDVSATANVGKFAVVGGVTAIAESLGLPTSALALAFTQAHPAVTSTVIGPREPEQLMEYLPYLDFKLSEHVLDAIDELVPPGTTVNDADRGWDPPWMTAAARRR